MQTLPSTMSPTLPPGDGSCFGHVPVPRHHPRPTGAVQTHPATASHHRPRSDLSRKPLKEEKKYLSTIKQYLHVKYNNNKHVNIDLFKVNIKVTNIGAQFQTKQIRDVETVPPPRAAHKNLLRHRELATAQQPTSSGSWPRSPPDAASPFSGKNTSHK